ncbi:MAG: hypothetical protein ABJA93_03885 [Sporichthyaceae bacterium]
MAKHRRAADTPDAPPARPAREILIWAAFGCALVPLALLWSGAGWAVALGVSGLIVLLGLACALVLRLAGMTLTPVESPPHDSQREDDRPVEP